MEQLVGLSNEGEFAKLVDTIEEFNQLGSSKVKKIASKDLTQNRVLNFELDCVVWSHLPISLPLNLDLIQAINFSSCYAAQRHYMRVDDDQNHS